MTIKDKIVSLDLSEWNHPRRVVAFAPLLFVAGWSVGFFLVPHLVESSMMESLLNGLLGVIVLLFGIGVLAVFD